MVNAEHEQAIQAISRLCSMFVGLQVQQKQAGEVLIHTQHGASRMNQNTDPGLTVREAMKKAGLAVSQGENNATIISLTPGNCTKLADAEAMQMARAYMAAIKLADTPDVKSATHNLSNAAKTLFANTFAEAIEAKNEAA